MDGNFTVVTKGGRRLFWVCGSEWGQAGVHYRPALVSGQLQEDE